jgi:hypothetical protein
MKRLSGWVVLGLGALLVVVSLAPQIGAGEGHAFIGSDKCKMCHHSSKKGAQYTKWKESDHAKAYETLASDEAKKIAAEKGLGDPQKADECLKCHITGHGAPAEMLTDKYKIEEGVGCEACHGAGGGYWKMTVMKDREASIAKGMIVPDEGTCKTCHNEESPTYKPFSWDEKYPKVAHPNPAK